MPKPRRSGRRPQALRDPAKIDHYGAPARQQTLPPAQLPCPACNQPLRKEVCSGRLVCLGCRGAFTFEQIRRSMQGRARLDHERRRQEALERNRRYREEARAQMERERAELTTTGVVYYIRFRDAVKVGTSINVRRRLDSVPWDEVLALEPGGRATEHLRHLELQEAHLNGEWFEHTEAVEKHIQQVREANAGWLRNVFPAASMPLPRSEAAALTPVDYPKVC